MINLTEWENKHIKMVVHMSVILPTDKSQEMEHLNGQMVANIKDSLLMEICMEMDNTEELMDKFTQDHFSKIKKRVKVVNNLRWVYIMVTFLMIRRTDMDNLSLLMEECLKEDSLMDILKEREQSDYQMVKL